MVYWQQFKSLWKHKYFVLFIGLELKVPIWRLIVHDWSKFLPIEFFRYARWKFGDATNEEWARGWLHHLHCSPHHPEHWILSWHGNPAFYDKVGEKIDRFVTVVPMPEVHVREMLADMHATGKEVTGHWDISAWFNATGPYTYFHSKTLRLINKIMEERGYYLENKEWTWTVNIV